MFPEFPASTDFPRTAHPGTVTFVGPDGSERVEQADHLPDWLKFAPDAAGRPVPVVKVVRLAGDRSAGLRSYGADGSLLWVGLTVPPAPGKKAEPSAATQRPAARRVVQHRVRTAEATGWF